ncbi:MAG: hypothetical protein KDB07_08985 [Planctomycetes bacterium]|nr:hypothetical protein [Planctomycetota bacterium]
MLMNGFEEALRIAADSRLQVIEKTPDAQVYHALMNAIVAGEEWRPLRKESPQSEIEAFLAPDYPRQELARFRVQASFLGVIARAGLAHYAEVVERLMQQTSNAGVRRAAYACLLRLGASADGSLEAEKDFLSEVAHLPKGRVSNEDIARIRDLYANASDVKPLIPHALYVLEEQRHSTMGAVAYAFSEALLSRPDLRTFRDDVLSNLLKSSSRSAWALLSMVLAKAFAMTDDVRITGFVEAELASPAADERYNEYTNQVYYGHLVSLYDEVVIDKRRVVYLTKVFRNSVDPLHRNIHDRVYPLYLANGLVDKKYKQEDEFWAREVAELTAWAADRTKFLETQRARLVLAWSALKKEGALHALEFQLTQPGNSREAIVLLGEVRESIASGQGWR